MTVRQFYYTSCERGADGIQGFQVNAITPGVDRSQVDAGLPLSLYRPPPAAPTLPTDEQLREFPVAVGYRRYETFSLLFHSRYLGADFTGRQGNYFAHVAVLDGADREFGESLPMDSWGADGWTWQLAAGPQLPTLPGMPRGTLTESSIGEDLRSGRIPEFDVLLSAVQDSLPKQGSRVVVVAETDAEVARAIAAVTRSLPPALATQVSFTTFSSNPSNTDLLVVGTTPDVTISASPFAQQTVLRIGRVAICGAAIPNVSRYARVLAACWTRSNSEARQATSMAASVIPPIQPAELDELSFLIELTVAESPWEIPGFELLRALEFAFCRWPEGAGLNVWPKVGEIVERDQAPLDVRRWSDVLAAAQMQNIKVLPVALETRYLKTALNAIVAGDVDPAAIWMPQPLAARHADTALAWAGATLTSESSFARAATVLGALANIRVSLPDSALRELAEQVFLPQLIDPATSSEAADALSRLPAVGRLLPIVGELLEDMVESAELFELVVEELAVTSAQLLSPHIRADSRSALALAIVQARAATRGFEPVQVLNQAIRQDQVSLDWFADMLWRETPTAAQAVAICRNIPHQRLASSRLLTRMVDRLMIDVRMLDPGKTSPRDDVALADVLYQQPLWNALGESQWIIWGIVVDAFFRDVPDITPDLVHKAVDAVQTSASQVPPELGDRIVNAVAGWMLGLDDAMQHRDILCAVLTKGGNPSFMTTYRPLLGRLMREGHPANIASVLPALVNLGISNQTVQELLDTTCANILNGRKKRDLGAIGDSLAEMDEHLKPLLLQMRRKAPPSWAEWWQDWQESKIDRSLTSRLFGRRRPKGES